MQAVVCVNQIVRPLETNTIIKKLTTIDTLLWII